MASEMLTGTDQWYEQYERMREEILSKPPYTNLRGVDKPPKFLAQSAKDMEFYLNKDRRLQRWYEVDQGPKKVTENGVADRLAGLLEDSVDDLVDDEVVPDDEAAIEWIVSEHPDYYAACIQKAQQEEEQWVKKCNSKRLYWMLNRAILQVVWGHRMLK